MNYYQVINNNILKTSEENFKILQDNDKLNFNVAYSLSDKNSRTHLPCKNVSLQYLIKTTN